MPNLRPITVQNFIVTISGLPTMYFTKMTRPKETRTAVEYSDGQTGTTFEMPTMTKRDNVTLTKPFAPSQDKELIAWYNAQKVATAQKFTVAIQPVNSDLTGTVIAGAGTIMLLGCEVLELTFPEYDRAGTSVAEIDLKLLHDSYTYQ